MERAVKQNSFDVVSDQHGRPTYTKDLANAFSEMLTRDEKIFHSNSGETFHLTNDGTASWADFARAILDGSGFSQAVIRPINTAKLARPAARPANSVMSLDKSQSVLGIKLRPWQEAIKDFIREYRNEIIPNSQASKAAP